MDSTKHNTASEDSTAHGEDRHESEKWKATRLIDERTGDSCIGFHFPTWQHGPRFEVIDEDLAEQPGKVRERLKKRGAAFEGTKDAQIAFTHKLLKQRLPEPLTLAMKPGFRNRGGFVLGSQLLGTAKGSFWWDHHAEYDIGDRCGGRAAWNHDVGKVAADSTYLTFALCVTLGAPLPTYVLDRCQKRLVSETAVFNFSGESGSGKSSINRAAAGTFGLPRLGKWDFTRRGLEESAEERNDLTVILDDTESHNEEHLSFKSALRYVNQIVTSGQSKTISKVAREARLPFLTWTAWGLTSSPKSLEEIAEEIGWNRTNGERVRFIDIPVPPVSEGGIFDWLEGDELQRIKQSKQLIDQLDKGVTGNYGGIFPLWIKFLLSTNCAEQVCRLTEQFVTRVAASADGYDERFAKKFAVPAIAGYLAAKYGIVPWPKMWPVEAAECCYNLAIKAVRKDADVAGKKIQLIAKFATNPNRFIPAKSGASEAVRFDDNSLGVRTSYLGQKVLAIRDQALGSFAGSSKISTLIIEQLRRKNILIGGQGHAGTTQLQIPIDYRDHKVLKPRFWIIDPERLRESTSSPD